MQNFLPSSFFTLTHLPFSSLSLHSVVLFHWPTYLVLFSHPSLRTLVLQWLSISGCARKLPFPCLTLWELFHLPWRGFTSCPAAESPSAIFHHTAPHPPALSRGKYQDNQTCLPVIHVTICLGFPVFECSDTHPASQNISGLLLSKFLNLNKHERPNSALGSVCTNPICDIEWGCLNQCEHGVWPRAFQLIYGVHLAALNQVEPGLSTVFKQHCYPESSAMAAAMLDTRNDDTALSLLRHFPLSPELSDTACLLSWTLM